MSNEAKGADGFPDPLEESLTETEEMGEMKILKRKKTMVEGMDCQIRKPRKRFLTTISGGPKNREDEGISLSFSLQIQNRSPPRSL